MTKMSDTPQDRSADGVPEVEQEQCIGLPLPVGIAVPRCGTFAAHYPHPIGESIRYRRHTDEQDHGLLLQEHGRRMIALRDAPLTPAEQRTGVSGVQASIADDLATLRAWFETQTPGMLVLGALDRIAALVPQRATVPGEGEVWMHACGAIATGGQPRAYDCYGCRSMQDWRALYTVPGR